MKKRLAGMSIAIMLVVGASPSEFAAAGACPIQLPQGSDPVTLDRADFVDQSGVPYPIDNPYWPMAPGTTWIYRESDSEGSAQRVEVSVLTRTRQVVGIDAVVIHDRVSEHGELIENTFDWYAQDVCGNVWYLGENTKEYENGVAVSTSGSWESGVDGAQPGIIMPADPRVGLTYRQEYYAEEAEDAATVLSLDEQMQVPFGHFSDALFTKDYTSLHRRFLEYKLYARGVGPVLAIGVSGGSDREELVRFEPAT